MPEASTIRRAQTKQRQGKALSTQAGEFVKEEMHHIREGKHGARSPQQAIAIGLSKARQAGVDLKPPRKGQTSESTRKNAERTYEKGQISRSRKPSPRHSKATLAALKREGRMAASPTALSNRPNRLVRNAAVAALLHPRIVHHQSQAERNEFHEQNNALLVSHAGMVRDLCALKLLPVQN